jgi:hypothetical protein
MIIIQIFVALKIPLDRKYLTIKGVALSVIPIRAGANNL